MVTEENGREAAPFLSKALPSRSLERSALTIRLSELNRVDKENMHKSKKTMMETYS
jgi:hypothetical protein